MLDELSTHIDATKTNDLLGRLENINTNTALAAEAELSMVWAISQVAHLTAEPKLPNSPRRPDAFSDNLFASAGAVIEVTALSDDSFSGKKAMDRTANIIAGYADQLSKGAGQHLYFEFFERSYWNKRFHRERCVDPAFELTDQVERLLRQWITAKDWPALDRVRITEGKTDLIVSWHKTTHRNFRVHCRMPPVAYDLEDNPIYRALKLKADQMKGAAPDTLRCVFLVDAGCDLLHRLRPMSTVWEVGGEAIIRHAIQKRSIDVVCVFSPYRERPIGLTIGPALESHMLWKVTCFDGRNGVRDDEYDRLNELAAILPPPRFEGYQARDRHRAGDFNPKGPGWYLATRTTTWSAGRMTIKISSRLVQEYLAGRMDAEAFRSQAFNDDTNYFDTELTRGHTIQDVRFEGGKLDEDDDYLVFDLDFDWGASALKPPKKPRKGDEG